MKIILEDSTWIAWTVNQSFGKKGFYVQHKDSKLVIYTKIPVSQEKIDDMKARILEKLNK